MKQSEWREAARSSPPLTLPVVPDGSIYEWSPQQIVDLLQGLRRLLAHDVRAHNEFVTRNEKVFQLLAAMGENAKRVQSGLKRTSSDLGYHEVPSGAGGSDTRVPQPKRLRPSSVVHPTEHKEQVSTLLIPSLSITSFTQVVTVAQGPFIQMPTVPAQYTVPNCPPLRRTVSGVAPPITYPSDSIHRPTQYRFVPSSYNLQQSGDLLPRAPITRAKSSPEIIDLTSEVENVTPSASSARRVLLPPSRSSRT